MLPFQLSEALGAAHGAHAHEVAALIAARHVTVAVPRALVEAAAEIAKDLPGTTANDVLVTLLRRGIGEWRKQQERTDITTILTDLAALGDYEHRYDRRSDTPDSGIYPHSVLVGTSPNLYGGHGNTFQEAALRAIHNAQTAEGGR